LSNVSRVIAVSRAVAESLRAQAIFDPTKIVTIPNGVDTTRFTERKVTPQRQIYLEKTSANMLVGMAGHIAPIKGQADFLRAAAILNTHHNDIGFVIAGEDKSRTGENRAAIEELIARLGLAGRVVLTGWLDDMNAYLSSLDLFVSPSRSEPFGLAIVEAMAMGVPVISSRSEGALEIIRDGFNGRLVPIGDVEALAKMIEEFVTNQGEQMRLSENARETARTEFSLERMVTATEDLYWSVVSEHLSSTRSQG
jgi:glycosyltransferase involved in cell wall biosynthesis